MEGQLDRRASHELHSMVGSLELGKVVGVLLLDERNCCRVDVRDQGLAASLALGLMSVPDKASGLSDEVIQRWRQ